MRNKQQWAQNVIPQKKSWNEKPPPTCPLENLSWWNIESKPTDLRKKHSASNNSSFLNRKHLSIWFPCSPMVYLTPIPPWINHTVAAAHRLFDQQSKEEARLLVPSPRLAHHFHWISSNLEGIKEEQSGVKSFSLGNFPFISISYSTDCQGNHAEVFSHW